MTSSHTEKLASAIQALDLVDDLLYERGMQPDCSARNNLAIARSLVKDVLTDEQNNTGERS